MVQIENVRCANLQYYRNIWLEKYSKVKFYIPSSEERMQWMTLGEKALEGWLARAGERGEKALAIAKKYNAW